MQLFIQRDSGTHHALAVTKVREHRGDQDDSLPVPRLTDSSVKQIFVATIGPLQRGAQLPSETSPPCVQQSTDILVGTIEILFRSFQSHQSACVHS